MSRIVSVFCVMMVFWGPWFVANADDAAQELATCLRQTPAAHPRLFFKDADTARLKATIDDDTLLSAVYRHVIADADTITTLEPRKREKTGKRLLGVSRTYFQRISSLAFAYRMTKEQRYLDSAKREMLATAGFEDWNPSHFLDVAEMTAALAIGYDWLYNVLDPETRNTVRTAIVRKGLEASIPGEGWVTSVHNWNQVCHGGLVLGALAILEDNPELSEQIIARAITSVPRAMQEYEPDGVYPEGPGYWEYGTTYNVLMIAALESALGSDFGLVSAKGFLKTPVFYLHATGPTGLFFNYSDCGARGGTSPAMHWFAQRCDDFSLLWRERKELGLFAAEKPDPTGGKDRMLPFLLVWGQPAKSVSVPKTLCWKGDGRTPVAMLRSSWQDDATYAAVKGGSPGTNHGHMDTGTFVLDMKGLRWALDLGSQGYNGLESRGIDLWNKKQDSERWTVFRLNNHSHNTLVVDGQLQRVDGKGEITKFSDDPAHPFAVVDMTPVYAEQLGRATRGVRLIGESVLIQDEIRTLERTASIRWAMATHADVTIEGAGKATLRQDGQSVSFRMISPADAKLAIYDIETPPRDYDEKNPNTRMIGFEATVAASTTQTWAIFIEPNAGSDAPPALVALKDW